MYCPKTKSLRYLSDPETSLHKKLFLEFADKSFLGDVTQEKEKVLRMVRGEIDPDTKEEFKVEDLPEDQIIEVMIQKRSSGDKKSKLVLPAQPKITGCFKKKP